MTRIHALALVASLLPVGAAHARQDAASAEPAWGHSRHGAGYDVGPRARPWKMEGIGSTPFPVTSAHPEVQPWFDQGMTLLHGFWYFEAERSFRWCLKLDPECAMAYWAMSLATREDDERSAGFLEEAVRRKDAVTERERGFIEVAEAFMQADEADEEERDGLTSKAMARFDRLLMEHPDDVEAKALYWLLLGRAIGRKGELARYGLEAVLDDILERDPDHVGALHYRIHNWDGKEGRFAVDSCMKLGEIAPRCGHLLHMPGHVLSGIGLWHEAAIAMDRATRVEKAYMHERMVIPEDNWDYVHNLDYLCYIQQQLGMVEASLLGAEQLLRGPGPAESELMAGLANLPTLRALVRFERWDEVLDPERLEWDESNPVHAAASGYGRGRALIATGRLDEAEELLEELRAAAEAPPEGGPPDDVDGWIAARFARMGAQDLDVLEGLLLIARGERLAGLALLTAAAEAQEELWWNDPPVQPDYVYTLLGEAYLELGAPALAVECFERTLETVFHDGFALAGLVVAHHALGDDEAAREALAKLRVVWSDADRPNRWLEAAEATGLSAEPHLEAPIEQRNYKREVLDVQGPSLWVPADAPPIAARDADGEEVTLEDHRGRNVLLIFYLGDECAHCIEQLTLADERFDSLADLETDVLAVSKDSVEELAGQAAGFDLTLLSDPGFENARRFRSYDDFEEIELHSTFLIDREGRVHWSRIGGEPFTDFDFLERELRRMNRAAEGSVADVGGAASVDGERGGF